MSEMITQSIFRKHYHRKSIQFKLELFALDPDYLYQ